MDTYVDLQQEPWLLLFFLILVFGLCVGSFLNVVIYRLPVMLFRQWKADCKEYLRELDDGQLGDVRKPFNLAKPDSTCPRCLEKIRWWQNVPLLSYLVLRGRCGHCGAPISKRYPFVEFVTALLSVVLFLKFGVSYELLFLLILTYLSIAMFGIDADHQILPDGITLPLLWLGLLINTRELFVPLETAVIGAAAGYLSLWSVYWIFKLVTGKEGMGYGDFKLLAACGAWFGWQVLPNVVLLSSVLGAVYGLFAIILSGRDSQKPMPFGPYIISAMWLSVVWPEFFIFANYL